MEPLLEDEVNTRGAYILFYQKRNSIPPWSASSSMRGRYCRSSWERGVLNKGKMLSHIKDQDRSGKGLKEEALSASLVAQLVKDLPAVQETPV